MRDNWSSKIPSFIIGAAVAQKKGTYSSRSNFYFVLLNNIMVVA